MPTSQPASAASCQATLGLEAALEQLLAHIAPLSGSERLPLAEALGRVLALSVASPIEVPGWDNSAMDGYAVRHADLAPVGGRLPLSQRIAAGQSPEPLAPGSAARIFTGAPVPPGADTVVVQEVCTAGDGWVEIPLDAKPDANIRRAGEEVRAGAEVLAAGVRLGPQHLGLAAAVGVAELEVTRRPRVAMLASGSELVRPGQPLAPGQIYNSNSPMLAALLTRLGCEVLDLGQVPDTLDDTCAALERGAREADLILTSGGVSVGEEDHIKPALERLGTLELWNVAIRPGKPLAFGHIQGTPLLGCPGNPVSLFVSLCLFARPLLLRLQGVSGDLAPPRLRLRAGFEWPRPDKRREFHRARIVRSPEGEPELAVYPSRSSALIGSLTWAEGLVDLAPGRVVRPGDAVDFLSFAELFPS